MQNFNDVDNQLSRVKNCEDILWTIQNRGDIHLDPKDNLKFRKQIVFHENHDPKLIRTKNFWFDKTKFDENVAEKKKINKKNFGNFYMKTKEQNQKNMKPKSSIKAFTKEDIDENPKGDMERFFKVEVDNLLENQQGNIEIDQLKGDFIYRIKLNDTDKREFKYCGRMLQQKKK